MSEPYIQSENPNRGQSGTLIIGSDHYQPLHKWEKRQVSLSQGSAAASFAYTLKREKKPKSSLDPKYLIPGRSFPYFPPLSLGSITGMIQPIGLSRRIWLIGKFRFSGVVLIVLSGYE